MLAHYSFSFFLKHSRRGATSRYVYFRVIVEGIAREMSTRQKCPESLWDQKRGRSTGRDASSASLNQFLELLEAKVQHLKNELFFAGERLTPDKVIDHLLGKDGSHTGVLAEFRLHNDRLLALVGKGHYALGTHTRFAISLKHLSDFISATYHCDDYAFRDLDFQFILDYEFYLKAKKGISNNTALKYITNFRKIVLIALDKGYLKINPFQRFRARRTKLHKQPLSAMELLRLESQPFANRRLERIRDIFVFQCYTGLAYADAFNLKRDDLRIERDGTLWISGYRQKTGAVINVPLLPKAVDILQRYREHPLCLKRNSVLPVTSNQKMNVYLKEIGDICNIRDTLNTHKARRTFASTITLANGVPIHVVKEMMGHRTVQQTEVYIVTEQQAIGREMQQLRDRLELQAPPPGVDLEAIARMERELSELKARIRAAHY